MNIQIKDIEIRIRSKNTKALGWISMEELVDTVVETLGGQIK